MSYNPNPPLMTPNAPFGAPNQAGWTTAQIDQYIQAIKDAMAASSGFERRKLQAQLDDAQKARDNQLTIAKLGADRSTANMRMQLEQQAREFEARHALDYAKAGTDYLSTPDRYAQATDFFSMANRAMAGKRPLPYGAAVGNDFRAKTQDDWAVLASGGAPSPSGSGGPQTGATNAAAADPRVKALKGIIDAMPPSRDAGLDQNDYAVLQAAQALMSTNLRPGTLEAMSPGQRGMLKSYVQRSGRDWNDYAANARRQQPWQGSITKA